jgi:hypothetical protein
MTHDTANDRDDLRDLLTATFAAHEHLADPDRAVEIAAAHAPSRHLGRILLGTAAAVALVAGGTTYGLRHGSGSAGPVAGPESPTQATNAGQPPLPPIQTNAMNRAKAVAAALAAMAEVPTYPGVHTTGPNRQLDKFGPMTSGPPGHTVIRSRWWMSTSTDAKAVARWYAHHAPHGFHSPDGDFVSSSSSSGPGQPTVTVYAADYTQPGADLLPPHGVSIEVETMTVPGGTAVRAGVLSVWSPARPKTSFVQDVTSIDVRSTHTHFASTSTTTHHSFTVRNPRQVLRAAIAFNALPGLTPIIMSCPMMQDSYVDRIVFHTATGDVVAVNSSSSCGSGMQVRRDGHRVAPELGNATAFLSALGLHH